MDMNNWNCESRVDNGPGPYVANVGCMAVNNVHFRHTLWTGCNAQMTLMSIPVRGEVGLEMHEDTDQLLCVEQGQAFVMMGDSKDNLVFRQRAMTNDVIFVPAGTWHNVINTGNRMLKLSSLYAPPQHPKGTVHRTKADAEHAEIPY